MRLPLLATGADSFLIRASVVVFLDDLCRISYFPSHSVLTQETNRTKGGPPFVTLLDRKSTPHHSDDDDDEVQKGRDPGMEPEESAAVPESGLELHAAKHAA